MHCNANASVDHTLRCTKKKPMQALIILQLHAEGVVAWRGSGSGGESQLFGELPEFSLECSAAKAGCACSGLRLQ
jgi:hypothetical protein